MKPAGRPAVASRTAKLLVVGAGDLVHLPRTALPTLLRRDDLVVANDAATLPASLSGVHEPSGASIEIRLAGRRSLDLGSAARFRAIVFGAADYRTPTEHRPLPPPLASGDALRFGSGAGMKADLQIGIDQPLVARVVSVGDHPRLIEV